MLTKSKHKKRAQFLSQVRKVHRKMGALLFILFLFVSVSGILLGWKKHSGGRILPKSHIGTSTNLEDWLPLDVLHKNACRILRDSVSEDLRLDLERIDVRKDKGMVKFVFLDHFWGVQIDGATGELLHIERRNHDFIENIHDGSILDYLFDTKGEYLKLIYSTIMGLALLTFTISGFWLWYGPKHLRSTSRKNRRLKNKS